MYLENGQTNIKIVTSTYRAQALQSQCAMAGALRQPFRRRRRAGGRQI